MTGHELTMSGPCPRGTAPVQTLSDAFMNQKKKKKNHGIRLSESNNVVF